MFNQNNPTTIWIEEEKLDMCLLEDSWIDYFGRKTSPIGFDTKLGPTFYTYGELQRFLQRDVKKVHAENKVDGKTTESEIFVPQTKNEDPPRFENNENGARPTREFKILLRRLNLIEEMRKLKYSDENVHVPKVENKAIVTRPTREQELRMSRHTEYFPSDLQIETKEIQKNHPTREFKILLNRLDLVREMKRLKNSEFACEKCHKDFESKYQLRDHVANVHVTKAFACSECPKRFKQKGQLKTHIQTKHEKLQNYNCYMCEFTSFSKGNLLTHMRIHTGEKPYKCDKCPDAFSQASHLHIHKRVHKAGNKCYCRFCGVYFDNIDEYLVHKERHEAAKNFKCDQCPKSFIKRSNLKFHQNTIHGEKTLPCNICNKLFTTNCTLKRHQIDVHAEAKYSCNKCSFLTTNNTRLQLHQEMVHQK